MGRRRFANAFLTVGALLAATACTGLDQASAAGVGPADAVTQIAGQLADSGEISHTATYRLADGGVAKIVQDPSRTAYVWPTGRLILTPTAATRCTPHPATASPHPDTAPPHSSTQPDAASAWSDADPARSSTQPATASTRLDAASTRQGSDTTRCTVTAPAAAELSPDTGLITPPAIEAKLRAAAADPALAITERDTTIAERHAACVKLAGAFEVCVIGDGTLAAFTGTLAGHQIEMTLTDLTPATTESDFSPPPGATVVDNRPE